MTSTDWAMTVGMAALFAGMFYAMVVRGCCYRPPDALDHIELWEAERARRPKGEASGER